MTWEILAFEPGARSDFEVAFAVGTGTFPDDETILVRRK